MALVPFTGTIVGSTFDANIDDKTATLTTNANDTGANSREWQIDVARNDLLAGEDASLRSREFTPADTYLLCSLGISVFDAANGLVATATLTSPDNDEYQVGLTLSVSATTVAATLVNERTSYLVSTTPKIRLKAGVRWLLTITASSGSIDRCYAYAHLRAIRRRA